MSSIVDENNRIIEEIEGLIKLLDVETAEKQLIEFIKENQTDEKCSICDEKIVFKAMNRSDYFLNRIIAVNEVSIEKYAALSNRIQQINVIQSFPCNIRFMDMPINNSIFVVQLFYKKLYEEYRNEEKKFFALGLSRNINGRELRLEELSCSDRKIADELNVYILYVKIRKQLEALIDLCKSINFNYCEIQ